MNEMHVCVKCEHCRSGYNYQKFCLKNIDCIDVVEGNPLYKSCSIVRQGELTCKDYKEINVEFKAGEYRYLNPRQAKSFFERLKSMRRRKNERHIC